MKSAILLHGSYGSPYENWIPTVSEQIRESGHLPFPIALPTPDSQDFDTWAHLVDAYRDRDLLGTDSVVVAHSSSCAFAVRYLASRGLDVRGLITVAGFAGFVSGNETFDAINAAVGTTDPDDFHAVQDLVATRVAYFSDNDPNLPDEVLTDFATKLAATNVLVPDAGHFNASAGYSTFDDLSARVIQLLDV